MRLILDKGSQVKFALPLFFFALLTVPDANSAPVIIKFRCESAEPESILMEKASQLFDSSTEAEIQKLMSKQNLSRESAAEAYAGAAQAWFSFSNSGLEVGKNIEEPLTALGQWCFTGDTVTWEPARLVLVKNMCKVRTQVFINRSTLRYDIYLSNWALANSLT